jgi:DnaK suppressor protein
VQRATVPTVATDEGSVQALLEERRQVLVEELARLTELPPEPVGNLSFGKRIGDGTTEAVERISTTAAARSIAASIADIDRALAKLTEGTYGRCDECGEAISGERMDAIPWAAYCVTCSARRRRR